MHAINGAPHITHLPMKFVRLILCNARLLRAVTLGKYGQNAHPCHSFNPIQIRILQPYRRSCAASGTRNGVLKMDIDDERATLISAAPVMPEAEVD